MTPSLRTLDEIGSPASTQQVWDWLAEVEDPEIPVISIVDLGIVREVRWEGRGAQAECVVVITPTYTGCPATHVIAGSITQALNGHGLPRVRLETRLSPAWTTDWLSERGREQLQAYGIAPPPRGLAAEHHVPISQIGRGMPAPAPLPSCPRCGSAQVQLTSEFGSTPCKALYRCKACLEPFDHFKCH
jgi:ring-1,2-phenylacetyl-CoA epoxidase subunit PaaD